MSLLGRSQQQEAVQLPFFSYQFITTLGAITPWAYSKTLASYQSAHLSVAHLSSPSQSRKQNPEVLSLIKVFCPMVTTWEEGAGEDTFLFEKPYVHFLYLCLLCVS